FARIFSTGPDGVRSAPELVADLGVANTAVLERAVAPAKRIVVATERALVDFDACRQDASLSVRSTLRGKHILLVGVTGFIGKVWLANTLLDLPEIGQIYLLIRRQKSNPAQKRFEKLIEESPVFDRLYERYGQKLLQFINQRVQVIEGDVTQPGLGFNSKE